MYVLYIVLSFCSFITFFIFFYGTSHGSWRRTCHFTKTAEFLTHCKKIFILIPIDKYSSCPSTKKCLFVSWNHYRNPWINQKQRFGAQSQGSLYNTFPTTNALMFRDHFNTGTRKAIRARGSRHFQWVCVS